MLQQGPYLLVVLFSCCPVLRRLDPGCKCLPIALLKVLHHVFGNLLLLIVMHPDSRHVLQACVMSQCARAWGAICCLCMHLNT